MIQAFSPFPKRVQNLELEPIEYGQLHPVQIVDVVSVVGVSDEVLAFRRKALFLFAGDEYGGDSDQLNLGENDVVNAAVRVRDPHRQIQRFVLKTLVVVNLSI